MSSDYRDLLAEFNAHSVEYLVVGAHALAAHGRVRATKDLDIWVRPTRGNAVRAYAALAAFGASMSELREEDLSTPGVVFQIGVEPLRIDVITEIDGVEFEEAWAERLETRFEGQKVAVISRKLLIRNKRAAGRTQDLADVEWLEETGPV